ncbi:ATP-binding protein [Tistrella mobilis]|uniref:ATP-binding protein n=1 Tax=Tistrella mobilis TaxID=171437 RepID=UPI000C0904BB|nr:Signal transduction histidine kinase [Tistrella sp.]
MTPVDRILRTILPRSLYGRSFLMIVAPLVVLLGLSTYLFYNRHWDNVTRHMTLAVAGDIALTVEVLRNYPEGEERDRLLRLIQVYTDIRFDFRPGEILPNAGRRTMNTLLERMMTSALDSRVYRPFVLDAVSDENWVIIDVQLQDGVLGVKVPRKRVTSATTYIFIMWLIGISLTLMIVAMIFLRNQMRSLRRLASAADNLGKGRDDLAGFKPSGATEVRQVAHAFIRMRDRIHRQVNQRTEMLAGVSHDLRTPLTRMKLQLALMPPSPDVAELEADVEEMTRMVEGYLAFARGEGAEEPAVLADLAQLVQQVVFRARGLSDARIDLKGADHAMVLVRTQAFRRCLGNVIDNAIRHADRVEVTILPGRQSIQVLIDDDGPGIPADLRVEAFRPFRRLDDTGPVAEAGTGLASGITGVGLGLAIARDVMRGHGGDIRLEDSPLGGLRVVLDLPV